MYDIAVFDENFNYELSDDMVLTVKNLEAGISYSGEIRDKNWDSSKGYGLSIHRQKSP